MTLDGRRDVNPGKCSSGKRIGVQIIGKFCLLSIRYLIFHVPDYQSVDPRHLLPKQVHEYDEQNTLVVLPLSLYSDCFIMARL
jgi:hypothetical protein